MKYYIGFLALLILSTPGAAQAEIEYNNEIYGSDAFKERIENSSIQDVIETTKNFTDGETSPSDLKDALDTTKELSEGAKNAAEKTVDTFEDQGIDIIGILKTIGSFFIIALEFLVKLLKWLVDKL